MRLSGLVEDAQARREYKARARAAIEGVPPVGETAYRALTARTSVWFAISEDQYREKDYAAAKTSLEKATEAAEAALRLAPDNTSASRNLALNHKTHGATLEMLGRTDEALTLYGKAMALDRERVAKHPETPLWKLDLSFSYGAVGAALSSKKDYRGALDQYDKAVALREEAVAADPDEDFAKGALARGYDRQAGLRGRLGDVAGAVEAQMRRVAVYDKRLKQHPERDNVWREYAHVAISASGSCLDLLEKAPSRAVRRQSARQVQKILDDLVRVRARWGAEKRSVALPPSDDELKRAVDRCSRLLN